jgi:hypothetical protein
MISTRCMLMLCVEIIYYLSLLAEADLDVEVPNTVPERSRVST